MASSDSQATVIGYASLANKPYTVRDSLGTFIETVAPQAFRGVLAGCDCRYLFNHDGMPLARNTAGTLDLKEDSLGLFYEARLDTSMSVSADLVAAIERGDVTQNSFGFAVAEDTWDADYTRRTITKIAQLFDVSAVTYPASPTTWLKMKTDGSEAQRTAMYRAAIEMEMLGRRLASDKHKFNHINYLTGSKEKYLPIQNRTQAAAERMADRLTNKERAAMLKAGERRKAKLDDGRKTYRSVFGEGAQGAERR
ncbi:MAG: hypothetical protein JWO74_3137 [Solirubrobacterales bacterium]|nr:hypothetical protein [Solirubrobacterales bacterium]